ncbi:DNA methyltransferase, partial [Acidilobus sp.]|uniref:DNA methyltransferase n=1 Tax=Acidilobus sp. TaxID=1872109 RepID=UPI003D04DCA2
QGQPSPQIPRALTLMYTKKGDTTLDPMVGSDATYIEAKLMSRNCIGVDVNYDAVMPSLHRLYWLEEGIKCLANYGTGASAVNGVTLEDVMGSSAHIPRLREGAGLDQGRLR